jgi:hypothetical protein
MNILRWVDCPSSTYPKPWERDSMAMTLRMKGWRPAVSATSIAAKFAETLHSENNGAIILVVRYPLGDLGERLQAQRSPADIDQLQDLLQVARFFWRVLAWHCDKLCWALQSVDVIPSLGGRRWLPAAAHFISC